MAIRVGINGFGRIGRNILRAALHDKDLDFVAVNDITDAKTLAHLLKYDSILGNLPDEVKAEGEVLNDRFGIVKGQMTTVHSYTNDQKILDLPHKDLRRARAAGESMIPTSTGAAKAIYLAVPELKGKLDGVAIRVPTPNVSIVDLTVQLAKAATAEEINAAFEAAAAGPMKGVLTVSHEELVSIDFRGNPASSIVDAPLTKVVDGTLAKVFSWYDNEWGFSCRVKDLLHFMARKDA